MALSFQTFLRFIAALHLVYLLSLSVANALPTVAGTVISNQAQLRYNVNFVAQTPLPSNTVTFAVQEVVNVSVVWQDASSVRVNTPQTNAVLTFVVNNTGNGTEAFSLFRTNAIGGDQFDPPNASVGAVFIENGLQVGFQPSGPNADALYMLGVNEPVITAGASVTVYAVSDIPSALSIGNIGFLDLQVRATTIGLASSIPGTAHVDVSNPAMATNNAALTVVAGLSRGIASARGSFLIDGVEVRVFKSVLSPSNPDLLIPGVEILYQLLVKVQGIGSVQQLVISDPLPAQLTYVPNSIRVNNQLKTDAADGDSSQFASNTVTVNLGNVTAPTDFVIELKAILK